jgi:DHA1 family L-arabinose/isopropyl-beta-D-thiogalactopyranoside export protein-like MFS transporter/DHA1 family inner membrane transport protein
MLALSLAAFTYVTTELLPVGLLTLIAPDLDRSRTEIGLLVTGYAVVVFVASVPLTRITQRIPRRRLLGATLAVFTAATAVSAFAPSYPVLAGARLVTALTQALFWSVVAPTAMGLFRPEIRGRMVARFSVGPALAPVLGVPFGTWLGQQAGWRTAFAVMAAVGLATGVAVVAMLPSFPPSDGGAARGTSPDRHRFRVLMVTTALAITGFMTAQTYITPFLLDVTGFAPGALAALLFVSGAAGVLGTVVVGRVLDARPVASLVGPLILLTVSMLGLFALGAFKPSAVGLLALGGFGFSSFAAAVQSRVLQVAPASTDLASAWTSSAFNVGIAGGSFIGGVILPALGARPLALVGGALTLAALAVLSVDGALRRQDPAPAREMRMAGCGV